MPNLTTTTRKIVSNGVVINMFNSLKENNIKEIKEGVMVVDNVTSDREYQ